MRSPRRTFLKQTAGLTFCLALGDVAGAGKAASAGVTAQTGNLQLNAYVNIAPDGTISIYCPSSEMGQGVMTALPVIVAEELDADWSAVRAIPSPPVGEVYGDPVFLDMIFTVSSRSVAAYFDRLRRFGAQARKVLMNAAAAKWEVAIDALHTTPGTVVHTASGRKLGYGEIAAFARVPAELPEVDPSELKDPAAFRLIGAHVEPVGLVSKTRGALDYSIDAAPSGAVHAAVLRAPILGARVNSLDDSAARAAPGVIDVKRRDAAVAVIADSYYHALRAKQKLVVEWSRVGEVNDFDSDSAFQAHALAARDLSRSGVPWDRQGTPLTKFEAARRVYEREYRSDFMYHAGIEPLNALVWVKDDGESAEAWVGTQAPRYTIDTIARMTGLDASRVLLHRSPMGGAFGRRSVYSMDFVEDAAWLSREIRRPVKVIWDREEDVRQGYFRPMSVQFLRAGLDDHGRIIAWQHRVACEDPLKVHEPLLWAGWQQSPLIGMDGSEHQSIGGEPLPQAYDLPDRLVEYVAMHTGIRVYAMRGVGSMANRFAVESFMDEIALDQGIDPIDFRMKLLHRSERAGRALEAVADMSDWGKSRIGRGLGVAYSHHETTPVACVAEVSVEGSSGRIRVHEMWVAADVGIAVQPDNLSAQLEGGVIYGLSNALSERITIRNGLVQESNFHDYRVMRMADAPLIHTRIIDSGERPSGAGEMGTVVAAHAAANAFAALTGRRIRHLPLTPERVKEALA
jgi:isoquinoline 1-oxidoreductase beta subunit